ncbi:MAG: H/ACA ribonucleoprotein complex subunit GAR1 [Acidilobus sp.]
MLKLGAIRSMPRGALVVRPGEFDLKRFKRGLLILQRDGRRVGVTYDIIGNVNSPYVVVKLDPGAEVSPGEELFVSIPSRPPALRRGRRWRR